jgi:transcriptional regulator with XRE-family HTH domain
MRRRTTAHTKRLLARNLRRLRLQRRWSQDDLAAAAGVRQALVSALEVTTANPTLESLAKIAAALDLEVADLLVSSEKAKADLSATNVVPDGRSPHKARYHRAGSSRR